MASILESFYILFDADTDPAKKKVDEFTKANDNLEKKLNTTDIATQKIGQSFHAVALQAAGAIAAFVSVGAVLSNMFAAESFAADMQDVSESIDGNISELTAWGDAAKKSGGSAQELAGDIQTLSANMAAMDVTGKSRVAPFFKELGINMLDASGKAKEPLELFKEIAKQFEGMSKKESLGFGRKLGLSKGTIQLLQEGSRGIETLIRRSKELGTITTEQGILAKKWKDANDDLHQALRSVGLAIGDYVIPPLTYLVEKLASFFGWLQRNHGVIETFGIALGLAAGMMLYAGRAALWMGAKFIFGLWPVLAIIAGLLLLALVIQDVWAAFRGHDSITLRVFHKIKEAVSWVIDKFKELFGWVGKVGDAIANMFGGGKKSIGVSSQHDENISNILTGKAALMQAGQTPLNSIMSNSVSNAPVSKDYNLSIGEVNIETQATDGAGVANTFGPSLERQMFNAQNNADDGRRS